MKKIIMRLTPLLLCLWLLAQSVSAARLLVPGGQVIGLKLADHSLTVTAFDARLGQAAKTAGLQAGDRIVSIDAQQVTGTQDIRQALERSHGTVEIGILRNGRAKKLRMQPAITEDGPRLGVYLKEGVTGIGTITWYDRETGAFGALGHGVSNPQGQLVCMQWGDAYAATVSAVRKGCAGEPGQLIGVLTREEPIGALSKNTVQGVFGKLAEPVGAQPLPVASAEQIRTGPAVIRSTVDSAQAQEYSVEILKIYPGSSASGRNMLLKVTDPQLLETTGGIVQGMGVSYNRDNTGNPNSLRGFQVTDP